MPVKLSFSQTTSQLLFLQGEQTATALSLDSIGLPNGETLKLLAALPIPLASVEELTPGGGEFRFKNFPTVSFQLPAFSIKHPSLPLAASWTSARVALEPGKATVDVDGFKVKGKIGTVDADLHLVINADGTITGESRIKIGGLQVPLTKGHLGQSCLALQWAAPDLNDWLKLLAPDLADKKDQSNISMSLRLLWSAN